MSLRKESVVVITGAASGIGRALAMRLAREPIAGIAIADVNEETLAETKKLVGDRSFLVTSHIVDVADADAMSRFADAVALEHGRVTHVINNAGVALGGLVSEVSLDEIEWLMGINFWGVVHGTKFFSSIFGKRKVGTYSEYFQYFRCRRSARTGRVLRQ